MKTIFRFLGTGALTAVLLAVGAAITFGQDTPPPQCADVDGHNALYTKFTGMYQAKTPADMKAAAQRIAHANAAEEIANIVEEMAMGK